MKERMLPSKDRSGSGWFDRNIVFFWAVLTMLYGLFLSWSSLKSHSEPSDGGACFIAGFGLLMASRTMDQLRERIEELEGTDEDEGEETSASQE